MCLLAALLAGCGLSDPKEDTVKTEAAVKEGQKKDEAGKKDKSSEAEKADRQEDNVEADDSTHVVVIDPGHGGIFSGAVSGELVEKDLTLELGCYVKEYLEENYPRIKVYMTRDTDTVLSEDVAKDLEERCEYAKSVGAEILVSLHLNASEKHDVSGANMYISHREHVTDASRKLADRILTEIVKLGVEDCGIHTRNSNDLFDEKGKVLDYYAINRHCAARDIPGIIVEHCFIDSERDRKFIDSEEAVLALATADAEGIAAYFYGEKQGSKE